MDILVRCQKPLLWSIINMVINISLAIINHHEPYINHILTIYSAMFNVGRSRAPPRRCPRASPDRQQRSARRSRDRTRPPWPTLQGCGGGRKKDISSYDLLRVNRVSKSCPILDHTCLHLFDVIWYDMISLFDGFAEWNAAVECCSVMHSKTNAFTTI